MRDCWEPRFHQRNQNTRYSNAIKSVCTRFLVYFLLFNVGLTLVFPQSQSVDDPVYSGPPIACFSWDPAEPDNGQLIMFDASCSYQPGGCERMQSPYQNNVEIEETTMGEDLRIPIIFLGDEEGGSSSPEQGDQGVFHHAIQNGDPQGYSGESCCETMLPHIQSYFWDFGDGNTSTETNPVHRYGKGDEYIISLTVIDNTGQENTTCGRLHVHQNPSAVIDLITPQPASPGNPVLFVGHGNDSTGFLINYSWNSSINGLLSTQPTFTTSELSSGIHIISFQVQNDSGVWSEPVEETLIVNSPPSAQSGGPYFGWLGDSLTFDGSQSSDTDGTILNYQWDFDDETTAQGTQVTYTYTNIGLYTITLTVIDDLEGTDSDTTLVRIVGNAPIANASGPYFGYINQTILCNGSKSYDINGNITTYKWDFGDGTISEGLSPTHIYQNQGTYTVTLLVTDNDGEQDTDVTTAIINDNLPPSTPEIQGVTMGEIQTEHRYQVVSLDSEDDMIFYVFDWGDNTTFTSPFFPSGTLLSTSHTWNQPGTYIIHVIALDNHTISSETATFTVIITDNSSTFSQTNENKTEHGFFIYFAGFFNFVTLANTKQNSLVPFGFVSIMFIIMVLVFYIFKHKRF